MAGFRVLRADVQSRRSAVAKIQCHSLELEPLHGFLWFKVWFKSMTWIYAD